MLYCSQNKTGNFFMSSHQKSEPEHPFACPPEELMKMSQEFWALNKEIQDFLAASSKPDSPAFASSQQVLNFMGHGQIFLDAYQELLERPEQIKEATEKLMADSFQLWQSSLQNMGAISSTPVISPDVGDRRFKDPLWGENPLSSYLMQAYLLYARWIDSVAEDLEGLDDASRRKFKFYSRQFVDAVAPSNFAWANPMVVKKTLETNGENLISGMRKFLEDLKNGTSLVNIENTDRGAFKIGKDLASTPGKVVFQNEMMQLIQYQPTTKKVKKTPLLVVPAWINKFYILDLHPKNSFVKWLVDQGNTVFIISWVNPGPALKDTPFEDYLKKGSLEAIRVMQEITGEESVNLIGFCLGGISLSMLLGYLQKDAKKMIQSLTLMAAPLDFSQAGEMTIFTDRDYLKTVASRMDELGLLDGPAMGATFNLLRANDLIWSAFINNYLLGNEQTQFDMLYWNADTTNLPGNMFNFYIQEMFVKNAIMNPCQTQMMGRDVDISKAEVPVFLFGAHDDHIAPWKSMYAAIPKLHGPVKFVLGASGHIAGVVNPPQLNKYGHWENDDYTQDAAQWLSQAKYSNDSWWLTWAKWIKQFPDTEIDASARIPGSAGYKALEDAPGSYVLVTSDQALRGKG